MKVPNPKRVRGEWMLPAFEGMTRGAKPTAAEAKRFGRLIGQFQSYICHQMTPEILGWTHGHLVCQASRRVATHAIKRRIEHGGDDLNFAASHEIAARLEPVMQELLDKTPALVEQAPLDIWIEFLGSYLAEYLSNRKSMPPFEPEDDPLASLMDFALSHDDCYQRCKEASGVHVKTLVALWEKQKHTPEDIQCLVAPRVRKRSPNKGKRWKDDDLNEAMELRKTYKHDEIVERLKEKRPGLTVGALNMKLGRELKRRHRNLK